MPTSAAGAVLPHPSTDLSSEDHIERLFAQLHAETDPDRRRRIRDEIAVIQMPFAQRIASRYRNRGIEWDDLLQVAHVGLLKAIERYRPSVGSCFQAFAAPTVSGEVKRHFRDCAWFVRPPRWVQELQPQVSDAWERLQQELGREPTLGELAKDIGVAEQRLVELAWSRSCYRPVATDTVLVSGSEFSIVDTLGSDEGGFEHVEQILSLRPALERLTETDRTILTLRYLNGWTQARIGKFVGISQMQVSRRLAAIVGRLRAELDASDAA